MPILKRVPSLFLAVMLSTAIAACKEKEGPAEQAGNKIDETIEKMGEKIEEARDKVKEATEK